MGRLLPAVAIAALFASSAAIAQTTGPDAAPSTSPSAPSVTAPTAPTTPPEQPAVTPGGTNGTIGSTTSDHTMTDAEAKTWIDKAVYSSDDKNVGSIASILRDPSGKVTSVQADVGGFLGLGTTRVKIMPSQFRMAGDRIVLDLTSDQVKQLPKAED